MVKFIFILDQLPEGHLGFVTNLFGGREFTHFILKFKDLYSILLIIDILNSLIFSTELDNITSPSKIILSGLSSGLGRFVIDLLT